MDGAKGKMSGTSPAIMSVRPYDRRDAAAWNSFVAASKNGTFLFDRNYMDYHADLSGVAPM
jgi:hypothetical protein